MKTAAIALLLVTGLLSGAVEKPPPEADKVATIRAYLDTLVGTEIFTPSESHTASGSRFYFIEGDPLDKADHAFPTRVTITILKDPKKLDRVITVRAKREGLVFTTRDRQTEKRWTKKIAKASSER